MNIVNYSYYTLVKLLVVTLLWVVFLITDLGGAEFSANAETSTCNTVTNINGEYQCSGKCVVKSDDEWKFIMVSGEKDTVAHFPVGSSDMFYRVDIENNDFQEVEIGSFIGSTLRTATAQVSDNKFPVLEEYLFDRSDLAGRAQGFTKIVRNPSEGNFKSCVLHCQKM